MEIKVKRLFGVSKSIGLLGRKKASPVIFNTRFGIHTFGMRFPIDAVILNKNNEVVSYKKNLVPNRVFVWNPKYEKVLELPKGFISKNKIIKGDKLNLIYSQ